MKKRYPSKHVLIFLFLSLKILFIEMGLAQKSTAYVGVNVGVVLDLECFDVNIALSCIIMAFYVKPRLLAQTQAQVSLNPT
jgi:ionotropic glutamate receptor